MCLDKPVLDWPTTLHGWKELTEFIDNSNEVSMHGPNPELVSMPEAEDFFKQAAKEKDFVDGMLFKQFYMSISNLFEGDEDVAFGSN